MRASPTAEVSIIRRRRTLFGALVVRLFGRVIHRIVAAHLYRAHECNIITSLQLHDLAYYSELDLSRGGRMWGDETKASADLSGGRETPVVGLPDVEGIYAGKGPALTIVKPTAAERMFP